MYELCILHYHITALHCVPKQCGENWDWTEILNNFLHGSCLPWEIALSSLYSDRTHMRFVCSHLVLWTKQYVNKSGIIEKKLSRLLFPGPIIQLDWNLFKWQVRNYFFALIFLKTSKADKWNGAIYFIGPWSETCHKLLFAIMLLLLILRGKQVNGNAEKFTRHIFS